MLTSLRRALWTPFFSGKAQKMTESHFYTAKCSYCKKLKELRFSKPLICDKCFTKQAEIIRSYTPEQRRLDAQVSRDFWEYKQQKAYEEHQKLSPNGQKHLDDIKRQLKEIKSGKLNRVTSDELTQQTTQ